MTFSWGNFLSLTVVLLMAGCGAGNSGPELVPVTGIVTYDGVPLGGAIVSFVPKVEAMGFHVGSGTTNDAGEFEITTENRSGAVPGMYLISVSKTNPESPLIKDPRELRKPQTKEALEGASLIPRVYSDPKKSGFSADVGKEGSNVFKFELKKESDGKPAP